MKLLWVFYLFEIVKTITTLSMPAIPYFTGVLAVCSALFCLCLIYSIRKSNLSTATLLALYLFFSIIQAVNSFLYDYSHGASGEYALALSCILIVLLFLLSVDEVFRHIRQSSRRLELRNPNLVEGEYISFEIDERGFPKIK